MERLIIKNFGPIREADLTFRRFNVLIGEQATGKSTVAKLLAVCRYFSYLMPRFLPIRTPFDEGLIAWGLEEFIQHGETEIFYENEDYNFKASSEIHDDIDPQTGDIDGQYPQFEISLNSRSERFENLLAELKRLRPRMKGAYDFSALNWQIPTSFFQNEVSALMDNPFFLPAERSLQSIFSLGKSSIQNISDSLFNQLAKLDQIARFFKEDTEIPPLGIVYKNESGRGYFRKKEQKKFYSLFNAATGYQSIIPIVLLMSYYNELRKKPKTFIIEEPELNLFPTAQYELIKFLIDKTMNFGNTMIIATHSPYILASLNNFILAAQVGKLNHDEASKIVDRNNWLQSDQVSAYRMLADGTCRNIMDEETHLIHAEEIDDVSNRINFNYDKLCEIQYAE